MKKVVEVEWQDSQVSLGGWGSIRGHLKRRFRRTVCYSIGYVLADDKRGITIAGSVNGVNATGVVTIPRRQIVKRRRLR